MAKNLVTRRKFLYISANLAGGAALAACIPAAAVRAAVAPKRAEKAQAQAATREFAHVGFWGGAL